MEGQGKTSCPKDMDELLKDINRLGLVPWSMKKIIAHIFSEIFSQVSLRLKTGMSWPALERKSLLTLLDTPYDDSSRYFFILIIWRPPKKTLVFDLPFSSTLSLAIKRNKYFKEMELVEDGTEKIISERDFSQFQNSKGSCVLGERAF
jgi:hypothetical protein